MAPAKLSAVPTLKVYSETIDALQERRDWSGMTRYCKEAASALAKRIKTGNSTEEERWLLYAAYSQLAFAYGILHRPGPALRAAKAAYRALGETLHDSCDMYFGAAQLFRAYEDDCQAEKAEQCLLRCMAGLMPVGRETEFFACCLDDLAQMKRRHGESATADVLKVLAAGIRKERRRARRPTVQYRGTKGFTEEDLVR